MELGTLYLVSAPAGGFQDITLRARRILEEVTLVAAEDAVEARDLLMHLGVATPVILASSSSLLNALEAGDVALLSSGWSPAPSAQSQKLIHQATERRIPVVPIPGPALPVTAVVISSLPASSFIYLGQLPPQPTALLTSVADEQRTVVVEAPPGCLSQIVASLQTTLGERPLVIVTGSDRGTEVVWRGTIALYATAGPILESRCLLVVGGAPAETTRWNQDTLCAEIRAALDRGLGAKEISRELAAGSGWRRREIYDLAVSLGTGRDSQ